MDPHTTREDLENIYLEPLTHRHLKQSLSPLSSQPIKKKKLVNFRISRRRRSIEDHSPLRYHSHQGSKVNVRNTPIREEVEEDRLRDNDDMANMNFEQKKDGSNLSLSTQEITITPEVNGNVPSAWPQIPDNQRPSLNQITSPSNSAVMNQKITECVPLKTRKSSSASSWDKVKARSCTDSIRRTSLSSVVNNVVNNRRRGVPAPCIWTPAVPRSNPTPRPGNWREQEEPGSGSYTFSFISHATLTKTNQQIKQRKFQSSTYYQESQSPKQRKKHVEFYGKQYKQWLSDILKNPAFQGGHLMKGLEIGVQFPVVHMSPVPTNDNSRRQPESTTSSTYFGLGSDAIISQGVYEEVVSWVPELLVTSSSDPSQWARCFIIIAFKTLDGDFSPVEDQWREWTGALHVYFNISDDLHLKKLSFYRRKSRHQTSLFTYIVVIEVDTVTKENGLYLLDFVYRMRIKGMGGYLGVYQEYLNSSSSSTLFKSKKDINQTESPSRRLDSSELDMEKIKI